MAEKFVIQGGKKLSGEIKVNGSKNAATKMMMASLLTSEECILENFPNIGDTQITSELCKNFGTEIKIEKNQISLKTPEIKSFQAFSLSRKNRIPILALGPLLARTGRAQVPVLGGDKIGPRPVDLHLHSLKSLGVKIKIEENCFIAEAPDGLRGTNISFSFPSVGATENVILAAVLAKGKTIIQNAAVEPEVIELIKMLQKMGAIIGLGANRKIYIEGVKKLNGVVHRIFPDRNEAVSFGCLATAIGSKENKIKVKNAVQEHLISFLNVLRRIGADWRIEDDGIVFLRKNSLFNTEIETDTHPGFMTDWQQPVVVLLTQAAGVSVIHETIYEDRFGYAEDLNLMGADIQIFSKCLGELPCRFCGKGYNHSAVISGPKQLYGRHLIIKDLRAGIAHLIAALLAEGESIIEGIEELDRGYEKIEERLRELGADIQRIN